MCVVIEPASSQIATVSMILEHLTVRLLLGLKGTISELELHTIRGRLTAGLLAKAERGELALQLPTGLVRDPSGVVTKDPNREVQERITLVFESFLKHPHRCQGHAHLGRARPRIAAP
jgi:DNA invertase Pin-like site-specific DNA recombinase